MMKQKIFNFNSKINYSNEDFFVSSSNKNAFDYILLSDIFKNIILKGPSKSGKSHLGTLWIKKYNSIIYSESEYYNILSQKNNIFIDNFISDHDEEDMFHVINHAINNNLRILIAIEKSISQLNIKLQDLLSRLNSFHFVEIMNPDEILMNNILMKLLNDKQISINNSEVFSYITNRINRTYLDMYQIVEKIDKFSLEKKRQITIPLIKEII
tara:strand:- start:169 stop:804 length:636 start_codon:yes stop_codon:yes gene_type:complete